MGEKRMIPCLYLYQGQAVAGREDRQLFYSGSVDEICRFYSDNGADELLVFDLSAADDEHEQAIGIIKEICQISQAAVTAAGNIRRMEDVKKILYTGCERAVLNYDKEENIMHYVEVEDIRKYGMIPEFLGRLPIVFALDALSEDMLVRILTEPKNAIVKQYQKLLAMDEVKLEFEENALRAIARRAKEKDVGARALRAIIEEFMLDIMYEIPKDDNIGMVTITEAYIEKTGGPLIQMRG